MVTVSCGGEQDYSRLMSQSAWILRRTSSSFRALSFRLAVPVAPRSDFLSASCRFSTHSASLSLCTSRIVSMLLVKGGTGRPVSLELLLDDLHVPNGVDIALDVNDVGVVESA